MAKRILVIRFGSMGDVILTSPVVANLKIAFPNSHLVFLTKTQFAPLASATYGVDEVRSVPAQVSNIGLYQTLLDLDHQSFDVVVDLHGNIRSWFARSVISASYKLSYPKRRAERWFIAHRQQFPVEVTHTIDAYNAALEPLGISLPCRRPILSGFGSETGGRLPSQPYIVIAPGAAHPNKQYPIERFAEIALELNRLHGVAIVWAVTAQDAGKSGLANRLPKDHLTELIDTPVEKLCGVIAGALTALSNDSGLMHLSSAVGTPVVGIFGPTHPALGFAPRGLFDTVVQVDEPCRPCSLHGKRPCHREERFCFTRINSAMVLDALSPLIARRRQASPALLVDRDGTIMVDKDYLSDPNRVELIPGAAGALKEAQQRGFKIVVISNQSGVARGRFGLDAVARVNARLTELLAAEGVTPDGIYFCPHLQRGTAPEFALRCDCRKPYPGMAEQAARDLNLDLRRSFVVGDKLDDLNLARVIGGTPILVRTGYGHQSERELATTPPTSLPGVVDSLAGIVPLVK